MALARRGNPAVVSLRRYSETGAQPSPISSPERAARQFGAEPRSAAAPLILSTGRGWPLPPSSARPQEATASFRQG